MNFQSILRWSSNALTAPASRRNLLEAIGEAQRELAALEASIAQTAAIGERETTHELS